MGYLLSKDPPHLKRLENRWLACTDEGRHFAALHCGKFPGVLPHVIAELYDKDELDLLTLPPSDDAHSPDN